MTKLRTDVVILGAGFAGTLLSLILSRHRDVVLVERGRHPRFALGESSTPLANLVLKEIASDHDLPWLVPLAKYGSWKNRYPDLPCGLKRGFTFAKHHKGRAFVPNPDHRNELLVAASRDDATGDTQWLRADFDHFLVKKAVEAGIPYYDRVAMSSIKPGKTWHLSGVREAEEMSIEANFVVDASGASGVLAKALNLEPGSVRTDSWAVFSHFEDVERWEDVVAELGGRVAEYPYHADDAAMHHVLDDGWMYVLRFDSGIVSAGFLFGTEYRQPDLTLTPAQEWDRTMSEYPSVAKQFHRARPVRPIERTGRLQRFVPTCAGDNWALLAPAAYTLDALFSTGNAHALLTIQRLAHILITRRGREAEPLQTAYAPALRDEFDYIDRLVCGAYAALRDFPTFVAWGTYYFAGAIAAEESRLRGDRSGAFLSSHLPALRKALHVGLPEGPVSDFEAKVAGVIEPFNTAGLCDPAKRNLYPYG